MRTKQISVKLDVKVIYADRYASRFLLNGVPVVVCKSENYVKVNKDGVEKIYTNKDLTFVAWCFSQKHGVSNLRPDSQIDEFLRLTNCV